MNKIAFLMMLLPVLTVNAQKINQKMMDEKSGKEILLGYCNRDGFYTSAFDSSYQVNYQSYVTDKLVMEKLKSRMSDLAITIVMGSWCGDSKEQVPRFYRILDELSFDYTKLTLLCVDRTKKAGDIPMEDLKISLVPTFIFYRNAKEIGRITETPEDTLEKDFLKILGD